MSNNQQVYQRTPGVFESVRSIAASIARAATSVTNAAAEGGEALEVLARTGKNMAENNEEYLQQRSKFEMTRKLDMLKQEMAMQTEGAIKQLVNKDDTEQV